MPAPKTIQVDLQRSDARPLGSAYWGCPLLFRIRSQETFTDLIELRLELHDQRLLPGKIPLASVSVAVANSAGPEIHVSAARMASFPTGGRARTVYVVIRGIRTDGDPDVFELGTLDVISNPASDINTGEPPDGLSFATTTALAAVNSRIPGWVEWPLTGADDPRGRPGSRTFNPGDPAFWTKVSESPHLWVRETGTTPAPAGDLAWSDGTAAQWDDGTPIGLPEE